MTYNPVIYKRNRRTNPHRFFNCLYHNQIQSSKNRGMDLPDYSLEQLISWLIKQPNLTSLWDDYQNSGHQRMAAPSLDRLNDYLPYTLNNIRLVTFRENHNKFRKDAREGLLNPNSVTSARKIEQYSKDGTYIQTFFSSREAAEEVNGGNGSNNIRAVAVGRAKTAYGFIWKDCNSLC
jgi:hypothetical protein